MSSYRDFFINEVKKAFDPFGFKSISIGERFSFDHFDLQFLDEKVEAFSQFAKIIGINDSDISLNGLLKLEFVMDTVNQDGIHYGGGITKDFTISLNVDEAAYAHEWMHAADALKYNYENGLPLAAINEEINGFFIKQKRNGFSSYKADFPTRFKMKAKVFDIREQIIRGKKTKYLSKKPEMLAYGMEKWTFEQFEKRGCGKGFVVGDKEFYEDFKERYPSDIDTQRIARIGFSIIEDLKEYGLLCKGVSAIKEEIQS